MKLTKFPLYETAPTMLDGMGEKELNVILHDKNNESVQVQSWPKKFVLTFLANSVYVPKQPPCSKKDLRGWLLG